MKELTLIIPMAGMGTRLRPQTLLTPKPLFPIAGKSIVEHLINFIANSTKQQYKIKDTVFIVGNFGKKVENKLLSIAESINSDGHIVYQKEALGTAHAIYCAKDFLNKNIFIAFADTLFVADFSVINKDIDGIIWTKKVQDPRQFGVVNLDSYGFIIEMEEKPDEPKSNLAIIGIYFIKDGNALKQEIKYLLDNDIKSKGEYQLTDALYNLIKKGHKLVHGEVSEWMDCGNKDAVLDTHKRWLTLFPENAKINDTAKIENTQVIPPVFIGEKAIIKNSVVGPYVSVEANASVEDSVVKNSIIKSEAVVKNAVLSSSIIGERANVELTTKTLDISDFSRIFE